MFEFGKRYLDIGNLGESRFGSWLACFWFMVIGFLAGQAFVTVGLLVAAPNEIMNAPQPQLEPSAIAVMGIGMLSLGIGFLASILALFLVRFYPKSLPSSIFLLACIIMGLGGLIAVSYVSSSPESAEWTSQLMGHSPVTFGLLLMSFVFPFAFLLFGNRIFHRRTATSIVTAWRKIRWGRIILTALLTIFVLGSFSAIMHLTGISKVKMMFGEYPMSRFIGFALVSLLLIPFQSAAEELVFRGYLNQAFKKFIPNIWIVFVITSILFAAMHLSNPESLSSAEKGPFDHILMMSGYFLFGFILCVIVYFEGGLEAVIGVHAANNIFAAVFINYEGSVLPTPSVFLAPAPDGNSIIPILIVLSLIAFVLYLTRKKEMDYNAEAISLIPEDSKAFS